jgi:protein-tyrosine phosphatase
MIRQPDANNLIDGFVVLDIRERMLDARNPLSVYSRFIDEAIRLLHLHDKVVICCSAGVSRSNSIAIGVLVKDFGMNFEQAYALVKARVPIANPLPCHLIKIKRLVG